MGRRLEKIAFYPERILHQHVQAGKPDAKVVLAALGDDIGEDVQLVQEGGEAHLEQGKIALRLLRAKVLFALQQADENADSRPQLPLASYEQVVNGSLCGRWQVGVGHHGDGHRKRLHLLQPYLQGFGFFQQEGAKVCRLIGRHYPSGADAILGSACEDHCRWWFKAQVRRSYFRA
jgi:hypothetical protein